MWAGWRARRGFGRGSKMPRRPQELCGFAGRVAQLGEFTGLALRVTPRGPEGYERQRPLCVYCTVAKTVTQTRRRSLHGRHDGHVGVGSLRRGPWLGTPLGQPMCWWWW
ncbi:hypothetical protein GWK47_027808 [Chionoecetes opilio]|uniref:Uncharacterized protein n=1 Tax=Chionoecetes opilio TaxID=41210 RepID=A0A8J8WD45_CHIOP|nr:hypothetical protein GWK47_027808 [Chionoecetes opilio]